MIKSGRLQNSSTASYLIAVGFVSIFGQVVVLRELSVSFYGIELIYILSLGIWLLGTALGAAIGRRSGDPGKKWVHTLFLIASASLAMDIVFIRGMRTLFNAVPGGFLPFQTQMIGMSLAILPLSMITGLLFRWSARLFAAGGHTLAESYALESAGGVLGGLMSTLLLAWGLQNIFAGIFCCACSLFVVNACSWKSGFEVQRYISFAGLIFLIVAAAFSNSLDMWMTSWDHPDLSASRDTPYGRITVTSRDGQVIVFENDALSYETETTSAEELVQLSTLQRDVPRKVLVIGGGFAGVVNEMLKLPVTRIDYVEINKRAIGILRIHLPAEMSSSLNDERVRIIYDDPRRFLRTRNSYDAILTAMPEPMSAQVNRFYTTEFFRQCSSSLNSGGIFSFAIRSAENLWTPHLLNRNRSVYAALKAVFRHVVVVPGVTNIFIASDSALTTHPAILGERLSKRRIETRLVSIEYVNYLYTNDRFSAVNTVLSQEIYDPNSDTHPACYSHTISIWLSRLLVGFDLPGLRSFGLNRILKSPALWILALAAVVLGVGKRFASTRRFIVMFLAGAVGMISETVILLNYQSSCGALYQDIGLLLMMFMTGLAAGAALTARLISKRQSAGRRNGWWGAIILGGLGLLNLLVYYGVKFDLLGGLAIASVILALDGAFVAGVFAFESLRGIDARTGFMSWLYSADLIGGCIGTVAASLFLIPIFGIPVTTLSGAAIAFLAIAFLR